MVVVVVVVYFDKKILAHYTHIKRTKCFNIIYAKNYVHKMQANDMLSVPWITQKVMIDHSTYFHCGPA